LGSRFEKEAGKIKMVEQNTHGGKRQGAGRPKGSRMRRSEELADRLLVDGKCPVDALVRLAEQAESEGDLGQAIGAWKSVLPYIYPKPKAVEIAPEVIVSLTQSIAAARLQASRGELSGSHVQLMEHAAAILDIDADLFAEKLYAKCAD
jgi:hypothetical protein